MGQAVNRGTFEERKTAAIKRDADSAKIRLIARGEANKSMTPDKKDMQDRMVRLMEMMSVIGARDIFSYKI